MARSIIENALNEGKGILHMTPEFIPRKTFMPGRRLRLHPDDYTAFGPGRGTIQERWFSATMPTDHGPDSPDDEGLCKFIFNGETAYFVDAVKELKGELIGDDLWEKYGTWPMFSKFYDFATTSFFHVHPGEKAASCKPGAAMKPEAYYYPPQMNPSASNENVITYLGVDPSVTKEELKERLADFGTRDNHIAALARAYKLELSTGWFTPAGVLHGCGAWCTYEPQWMSESYSVFENFPDRNFSMDYAAMNNLVPDGEQDEIEYTMSIIDWEVNTDPQYRKKYYRPPITEEQTGDFVSKWVTYGNDFFGAKELTVLPGKKALVKDKAAYGCIIIQGYGKFGDFPCESPTLIRLGDQTRDEFFVSASRAKEGVLIENHANEPLVMLKHFCNNCGMPAAPRV